MGRLLILTFSAFAFGANIFAVVGLLTEVAAAEGVTIAQAGQVQTAFVLTAALAGPLLAIATRKVDRRRLLAGCMALLALSALACAAAPDFGSLLAARVAAGVVGALALPLGTAMAPALAAPEKRGAAVATVMLGMPLALIVAGPLCTAVGAALGWPAAFGLAAALAGLAAVAVTFGLPTAPGAAARPEPLNRTALARLWPLWAATLASFIGAFTLTSYLGPIAVALSGVSVGAVGVFQACTGVGSLVGIVLGGRAADRGAGLPRLAASLSVIAVCLLAVASAFALPHPSVGLGLALGLTMFVSAAGLFSLMPIVQTRLTQAAGSATPLALAINGSAGYLGQAGGAALGGVAIASAGLPASPAAGLVAASLGALIVLGAAARSRVRKATPALA